MTDTEPIRLPNAREVRAMRTSIGMTKLGFAKEIGVSHSAVRRWESGVDVISRQNARRLYEAMDRLSPPKVSESS